MTCKPSPRFEGIDIALAGVKHAQDEPGLDTVAIRSHLRDHLGEAQVNR